MQTEGKDVAPVVTWIFAKTDELLLPGLSIPFDDTLVLRARIYAVAGYLECSDTQSMSLVFNRIFKPIHSILISAFLVQLILLPQLHYFTNT
jgi:hypothetical protein